MTLPRRLATLALSTCLMILPIAGSSEAVIGTKL